MDEDLEGLLFTTCAGYAGSPCSSLLWQAEVGPKLLEKKFRRKKTDDESPTTTPSPTTGLHLHLIAYILLADTARLQGVLLQCLLCAIFLARRVTCPTAACEPR